MSTNQRASFFFKLSNHSELGVQVSCYGGKFRHTSTHIIVVVACIKNDLVLSLQTYCGVLKFEGVCEVCVAYTSWATFLSKLCIIYCITKNWTPEVCATRGQFIIFYN